MKITRQQVNQSIEISKNASFFFGLRKVKPLAEWLIKLKVINDNQLDKSGNLI